MRTIVGGTVVQYLHVVWIIVIKDLVNDDFKVITYGEFREKYCLSASFLEFYGVTSAIRSAMKSWKLKTPDGKDQGFSVQKLIAATKPTTLAYKILLQKNSTCPRRSQEKWVRDCDFVVVEDLSWRSLYLLPRFCTLSTKIRNFQFKFLHRSIATNSSLSKIGISETALRYLCKTDKGTLVHLFSECSITKTFWGRVHCFFVSVHLIPASHVWISLNV